MSKNLRVKKVTREKYKALSSHRSTNSRIYSRIIDQVNTHDYKNVVELHQALVEEGIDVTIHQLRRILQFLNIKKTTTWQGKRCYKPVNENGTLSFTLNSKLESLASSVHHNNNLIVVKTIIAGAQIVAKVIDTSASNLDILGTIAGDDTVLVIPKDICKIDDVVDRIRILFGIYR